MDDLIKRLEALGAKGLTIGIAYGPYSGTAQYSDVPDAERGGDLLYSVDVLWLTGEMVRWPYCCKTFPEAVEIAEAEVAAMEKRRQDKEDQGP